MKNKTEKSIIIFMMNKTHSYSFVYAEKKKMIIVWNIKCMHSSTFIENKRMKRASRKKALV